MPSFDRPSSQQLVSWGDWARYPDESVYPEMWDALGGYWLTEMGETGTKLINLALSGSEFDGTLNNDGADPLPSWVPMTQDGRPSLSFRAIHLDARVEVAGVLIPDSDQGATAPRRNELTIGCYLYKINNTTDQRFLAKALSTTGADHDYMLGTTGGNDNLRTRIRVDSTVHTDITDPAGLLGETHFVCATFDGVDIKHWVDGAEIGSFATSGTLTFRTGSTYELWLGNNKSGASATWSEVAMWCVYGRVLQPWEMLQLAMDPAIIVRPRPLMVATSKAGVAAVGHDYLAAIHRRRSSILVPEML